MSYGNDLHHLGSRKDYTGVVVVACGGSFWASRWCQQLSCPGSPRGRHASSSESQSPARYSLFPSSGHHSDRLIYSNSVCLRRSS